MNTTAIAIRDLNRVNPLAALDRARQDAECITVSREGTAFQETTFDFADGSLARFSCTYDGKVVVITQTSRA